MRTRFLAALVAAVSLSVVLPAAASAAGTITSGSASFVRGTTGFDATPDANLTGVGTGDYLFEYGWWIRVGSATAETFLPAPTTENYTGATSTITWTNANGTGLDFTETSQVLGLSGPSGIVSTTMSVTNPTAAPIELNLFHMADLDVNGSAGGDSVIRSTDQGSFRVTDSTAGFAEYRAPSADAFLARAFGSTTDVAGLLSDAAVTDFDALVSGVPASNQDVTAGYQWKDRTIPAGATRTFSVRTTGNTDPVATTTSTQLTSALNPSTSGGKVSLTATVSTNVGEVQFQDGGMNVGGRVPLVDGVATLVIPEATAGTHEYTARYLGLTDTGGSISPTLSQTVAGQADVAQAVDCPPTATRGSTLVCTLTTSHITGGPAQDLGVTLALPAGTSFTSVTGAGWDCPLIAPVTCLRSVLPSGSTAPPITLTFAVDSDAAPGARAFTASVSTDSDDLDPGNNTATDTVTVLAPTSTAVASSANPVSAGAPVTFTATVGDTQPGTPTGTVQFKDGGTDLGAPVAVAGDGTAALTTSALAAGSHAITAVYSGDGTFTGSTSTTLDQMVTAAPAPPPGPTPEPGATPAPTPTATPDPGTGGQGPTIVVGDPGVSFRGVQKRVTLSSKGGFGLRFGATGGIPLNVDVTAIVPGTKKKGKRKATKARTVRLFTGRGLAADSKGNVAVRVTLSKALRAKLPSSRKSFSATLTVKAGGRTLTHRFTLVRAKKATKKR